MEEPQKNVDSAQAAAPNPQPQPPVLSKSAQKKLAKQQRQAALKAQRKAQEKERKRKDMERRMREWEEKLSGAATEEERARMIEDRKEARRERMGKRAEERGMRADRLRKAKEIGQKVVLDLEFGDLMTGNEIHSLIQQIIYCYAVNGRCASPAHLCLTGCRGEMENQLQRIPGFDRWIIEKEDRSYIEAFQDQKENLVYLTADAETILDKLDPMKIYIIGALVDRNRWKGITLKKANDQGIQSARLPIGSYLKMSSSQVLTVNQVMEILLKYSETRDWKDAFFQVIPQRKRDGGEDDAGTEETGEGDAGDAEDPTKLIRIDEDGLEVEDAEDVDGEDIDDYVRKRQRLGQADNAANKLVGEEEGAGDFEGGEKGNIKEATNGMAKESLQNNVLA